MKLFLIRHTEAIDYETESVRNDENRYITPKGRKISTTVFKALKEELAELDKVFTSPLVRSVQTAEILAVILKYKNDVEIANELTLPTPLSKVLQLLKRNSIFKSIALVGHEPMMSELVSSFSDRKTYTVPFKKSGVCYIDFNVDKETGKFEWYFDPKTMGFIK
jgi:phosphohistidine phosphatase